MDFSDKNYYEILEVPMDASPEEIQQGYHRAKNAYSQDSLALYSLMSKDECDSIANLIDEAYAIISDQKKRRQYDEARGFNQNMDPVHRQGQAKGQSRLSTLLNQQAENPAPLKKPEQNVAKIVAKKKFSLEFNESSDMELKIEQATEFSGEFLKEIREYKNVDIPRMSDMTKVSKTYIKCIEEEDFEGLPAAVYVRGFVYQYAKCLKLNPDLVATSFLYRLKKSKESKD